MISFPYLIILSLLTTIAKPTGTADCDLYYGLPDATACRDLIKAPRSPNDPGGLSWIDGHSHLFSLAPGLRQRPPGLRNGQWLLKRTVPIFRAVEGCKLIVMPILYRDRSVSYDTAYYRGLADSALWVLNECMEQVPAPSPGLPFTPQGGSITTGDANRLVIVLYQAGSLYDRAVNAALAAGRQIVAYEGTAGAFAFPPTFNASANASVINLTQPNATVTGSSAISDE